VQAGESDRLENPELLTVKPAKILTAKEQSEGSEMILRRANKVTQKACQKFVDQLNIKIMRLSK